jgi:hypothetical protein
MTGCHSSAAMVDVMIETMIDAVVAAAEDVLSALGWKLRRIEKTGRGQAIFENGNDGCLIVEIGYWYPPGAHHLDDQPAIVLSYQTHGTPKVQIPYQGRDRAPDLRWSSTPDEITRQTAAVVGDFETSFLSRCPDRGCFTTKFSIMRSGRRAS